MQSRESRHIFDRVKDDTSSLLWLRDAESMHTYRSTGTQDLGTVNATFTFDPEVFNSKVYQRATRFNMIHALLPNRCETPDDASSVAPGFLRSAIARNSTSGSDNTAPVYNRTKLNELKIVMVTEFEIAYSDVANLDASQTLAPSNSSTLSIPETNNGPVVDSHSSPAYPSISMVHRYYNIHTRETLRSLPTGSVYKYRPPRNTDRLLAWSSVAREESVPPKKRGNLSAYRQLVSFQRFRRVQVTHSREPVGTTVDWPQYPGVKVLILGTSESGKTTLHKSMKIAFEDDDEQWRLSYKPDIHMSSETQGEDVPPDQYSPSENAEINCIPTIQEILGVQTRSVGMYESQYVFDGTLFRIFDVGGTRSQRRKWGLEFENVNSIIFTLDVSCYDQVTFEDAEANRMAEQLAIWDSLVRYKGFTATNFIVLFTKTDEVTPSRLEASPFCSLFPDYPGKPDSLEDILQYLAWRLDAASKEWTTRRLLFCNAGSIWDSPTNMAEVAVSALNEVGRL